MSDPFSARPQNAGEMGAARPYDMDSPFNLNPSTSNKAATSSKMPFDDKPYLEGQIGYFDVYSPDFSRYLVRKPQQTDSTRVNDRYNDPFNAQSRFKGNLPEQDDGVYVNRAGPDPFSYSGSNAGSNPFGNQNDDRPQNGGQEDPFAPRYQPRAVQRTYNDGYDRRGGDRPRNAFNDRNGPRREYNDRYYQRGNGQQYQQRYGRDLPPQRDFYPRENDRNDPFYQANRGGSYFANSSNGDPFARNSNITDQYPSYQTERRYKYTYNAPYDPQYEYKYDQLEYNYRGSRNYSNQRSNQYGREPVEPYNRVRGMGSFLDEPERNEAEIERQVYFNFYRPKGEHEDIKSFNENLSIQYYSEMPQLPPMKVFYQFMPDSHCEYIRKTLTYTEPTYIQQALFPLILAGRDTIAIAKTGSGKTFVFAYAAAVHAAAQPPTAKDRLQPICLVLAPTRELAQQSAAAFEQLEGLSLEGGLEPVGEAGIGSIGIALPSDDNQQYLTGFEIKAKYEPDADKDDYPSVYSRVFRRKLHVGCLYGGQSEQVYLRKIQSKGSVDVLIATPGRLQSFYQEGFLSFYRLSMIILDEADRLLENNFKTQLDYVFKCAFKPYQVAMFSATWPEAVCQLAKSHMCAERLSMLQIDAETPFVCREVKQRLILCENYQKPNLLAELLEKLENQVLIFVNKRSTMHMLVYTTAGSSGICGDMTQQERESVLENFYNKSIRVLFATDLLSRGIDILDLDTVINYDLPTDICVYVHRCGRTGRMEREGLAISFVSKREDKGLVPQLYQQMATTGQVIPKDFEEFAKQCLYMDY